MTERKKSQIDELVSRFETVRPKSLAEVEKMKYDLKYIGSGAYRVTYKFGSLPVVIKIPHRRSGKSHSMAEYRTIRTINRFKKYKPLKGYMPKVYYFDKKTGIMIMHYYKKVPKNSSYAIGILMESLTGLVWHHEESECDIYGENMGFTEDGCPVITDLGYFSDLGRYGRS